MSEKPEPFDLQHLRERLQGLEGDALWRGLEELAGTEEFKAVMEREFPQGPVWEDPISRRHFLKLMSASLALAGLGGCAKQPDERIFPFAQQPEQIIPGKPLFYATAYQQANEAIGILVESHMGRPTKIEGNPRHPVSHGATNVHAQAFILDLYDPDRLQTVLQEGGIATWPLFLRWIEERRADWEASRGAGVRLLTETVISPTLAAQIDAFLKQYPEAQWVQHDPLYPQNTHEGIRLATGRSLSPSYNFLLADVVLTLDADPFYGGPAAVRYLRDYSARRVLNDANPTLNRLYSVESALSVTGAAADHRLSLRASRIENFTRALAAELGLSAGSARALDPEERRWIKALAADLRDNQHHSLVIAGENQPPAVHALVLAINESLGSIGRGYVLTEANTYGRPEAGAGLRRLTREIEAGQAHTLILLGGNPVYTAPADVPFAKALKSLRHSVHLTTERNETTAAAQWAVPQTHPLEAWGDARAHEGTATIQQPLIAPLYGGRSPVEFVAALNGQSGVAGHDLVRGYWRERKGENGFEAFWRDAVHEGLVPETGFRPLNATASLENLPPPASPIAEDALEAVFLADPSALDGRFANNAWLQELPKPLTKLTWDNAAILSPATAERLRLANEEAVRLELNGRAVEAPVWIQPGHPDNSVTLHLGYGRGVAGRVGRNAGFNAYRLRTLEHPGFAGGLTITPLGKRFPLARTQHHHSIEGRNLVRHAPLEHFRQHPDFAQHIGHDPAPEDNLYPAHPPGEYAWGMAIDLNACIGCNACVVACQSENNIPVVGKEQVRNTREMHWLRIDRYFEGDPQNPAVHFQPMLCQHCENAPCEPVCPVAATTHSDEGLNEMTYNRCVGTRYCSNNCPYKVRRFNFLQFADKKTESLKLGRNPDVTVRSRGVMEKCTYCVQRISAARIQAGKEDRKIRDGEIETACQAACPAQAIVFGDQSDPQSRVAQLKAGPRNYGVLTELNTRPRTTYLAKVRNPNPELEAAPRAEGGGHGH